MEFSLDILWFQQYGILKGEKSKAMWQLWSKYEMEVKADPIAIQSYSVFGTVAHVAQKDNVRQNFLEYDMRLIKMSLWKSLIRGFLTGFAQPTI